MGHRIHEETELSQSSMYSLNSISPHLIQKTIWHFGSSGIGVISDLLLKNSQFSESRCCPIPRIIMLANNYSHLKKD